MSELEKLINRCKYGVDIEINPQRAYEMPVDDYCVYHKIDGPDIPFHEMIVADTMVGVTCYPNTSVSYFEAYDLSVEAACRRLLELIEAKEIV